MRRPDKGEPKTQEFSLEIQKNEFAIPTYHSSGDLIVGFVSMEESLYLINKEKPKKQTRKSKQKRSQEIKINQKVGKTTHAFYEQNSSSTPALLPPLPELQHALVASSTAVAEL